MHMDMKETIRLVQLRHPQKGRGVALVQEPSLVLLNQVTSVYELALEAIDTGVGCKALIESFLSGEKLDYTSVYEGKSEWSLLPAFDCPGNPHALLVSGTGLTHKNSALNRQMMHAAEQDALTDSMKMYQWGLEGGQPEKGMIGTQPEWFYKGTGAMVKGHGHQLEVPAYADDGGEEPEIAGVYVVDREGRPVRIGFTTGNEFSDHVMERKNYLYLAPSKLRSCAIGPELVMRGDFKDIRGTVQVLRNGAELWSAAIKTGESNMAHSLENLEYHHFKYAGHRLPLQAHVHFFGADAFSFGAGVSLQTGDEMVVYWEGMGRPLRNRIHIEQETATMVTVTPLVNS
jgi:hypothetical protein